MEHSSVIPIVVFHVNDTDSEDLLTALHLASNSGPETSYPRRLLSGLGKKTRIDGDGQKLSIENLSDEILVKGKPVESLVLEVVTVGLFGELTIPTQSEGN